MSLHMSVTFLIVSKPASKMLNLILGHFTSDVHKTGEMTARYIILKESNIVYERCKYDPQTPR